MASIVAPAARKPETPSRALPLRGGRARPIAALSLIAFAGDLLAVVAGLLLAFWLRFESGWITFGTQARELPRLTEYLPLFGVGTAFLLGAFAYVGVYDSRHLLRFRRVSLLIAKATVAWLLVYVGVSLALKFQPPISRIYAASSALLCGMCTLAWRWGFHRVTQHDAIARRLRLRVLFVGWTPEATRLYEAIEGDLAHPYEIVGCVPSAEGRFRSQPPPSVPKLGEYSDLEHLLGDQVADLVIVGDLDPATGELISLANLCEREFVSYKVIPSYFQILVSGLQLETVSGVPILGIERLPLDRLSNRALKRGLDIVGALVGLTISAPLMAVLGTLIYLESPGPIFYRQVRMGRNGKLFEILKLRSMRLDAEQESGPRWAVRDDPRRLRIGAFMREWNLDEIPQFWNVLKGEMSLVGPRPERPELIEGFKHQIPHYNARHASKPGITGWAQIHGLRGDSDLAQRIRFDIYYLENWSLLMDIQIMVATFLNRKNAY